MTATNKLNRLFADKKKTLFMAHMIAGYPTMEDSEKVAEALAKGGADIIELQIPFSDPMADGPTIAVASEDALKAGATVAKSLELLKKVAGFGKPIAVMNYTNPVFRYGIPKFVKTIATAGANALIVPDCPFDTEEGCELLSACQEHDIFFVPVVSPGVPEERLKQLAKASRGFVYCTSRQGITGATSRFAKDLENFAVVAKRIFNLPLAVGFGVKSKEDAQSLAKFADIVIAGSVFVNVIKNARPETLEPLVEKVMRELHI